MAPQYQAAPAPQQYQAAQQPVQYAAAPQQQQPQHYAPAAQPAYAQPQQQGVRPAPAVCPGDLPRWPTWQGGARVICWRPARSDAGARACSGAAVCAGAGRARAAAGRRAGAAAGGGAPGWVRPAVLRACCSAGVPFCRARASEDSPLWLKWMRLV